MLMIPERKLEGYTILSWMPTEPLMLVATCADNVNFKVRPTEARPNHATVEPSP